MHHKSVKKMKYKLRVLTNTVTGWRNENRRQKLAEFIRGWINYFSMADMKGLMGMIDEWLREELEPSGGNNGRRSKRGIVCYVRRNYPNGKCMKWQTVVKDFGEQRKC